MNGRMKRNRRCGKRLFLAAESTYGAAGKIAEELLLLIHKCKYSTTDKKLMS